MMIICVILIWCGCVIYFLFISVLCVRMSETSFGGCARLTSTHPEHRHLYNQYHHHQGSVCGYCCRKELHMHVK